MKRQGWLVLVVLCCVLLQQGRAMPLRDNITVSPSAYADMARLGINITKTPVRSPGMSGIVNGPGSVRPLVVGTMRFPVVAIKFPDFGNTNTIPQFDSMLFGAWPSGSAHDYYEQVSYGDFRMTGVVVGWYTSDSNKASYGYSRGFVRAAQLVKEAAQKSDSSVNYALYDNNDDGYVDAFTGIHAGMGYEETGDGSNIWSHSWSFNDAGIGEYTTNDPWPGHSGQYIKINDYTTDPERSNYSNHGGMVSIGVFCHEWGHALGLPDLYDTDGGGEGLGCWSLMAAGSWGGNNSSPYYPAHLDPWSKMELGWLNPTAVRGAGQFTLGQVETSPKAYWMMSRNRMFKEYFLVENRRKTMFDTLMYGQGLLIYHIDDSVIMRRWPNNEVNAGGTGWKYGVALEQADGSDHLFSGSNRGDANDPWPGGLGRTAYDSSTTPGSQTNYPTSSPQMSGVRAWNIPSSSSSMACSLVAGATGQFTGGPDASGYKWIDSDTTGGPAYGWNDISSSGTLLGYGDDARWSFSLPYNFYFYGTNYSTVWVCSNGWLSFGADPGTNQATNTAIPNAAAPNRAVFAFWDDLNGVQPDSGGVFYRNFGTSPNCSTIVMWKHARVKGSLDPIQNQVSFAVVLHENGRIQLRYRDIWLTDSLRRWGRSASVGIEDAAGSVGLQYLYNGSAAGNLLANERAIDFVAPGVHDVGATRIITPSGALDSGAVVTPACSVYNYGTFAETYNVRMRVGSYNQTAQVTNHQPGTAAYVTFPNWTALPRGALAVTCSTEAPVDTGRANDRRTGTVTVNVEDAACTAILAPSGTIDSGTAVTPQARVKNLGTQAATFNVTFRIGSFYTNTQAVNGLAAGDSTVVSFASWTATQRGTSATRCTTALTGDQVASNNAQSGSVTVRVADAAAVRIVAPSGTIDSGVATTPQALVRNQGTGAASFPITFRTGSYSSTQTVIGLAAGDSTTINFASWTPVTRGANALRCTTALTGDQVPLNDTASASVTVRVRDVAATRLVAPTGSVDSGASVTPACSVYNHGTTTETYDVRMSIGASYDRLVTVTNHAPGATLLVTFPAWTADQRGAFAVTCSTRLTGDMVAANNRQTGVVTVLVADVAATAIIAPSGTLDSGATAIPQATVRNNGTEPIDFDVRFYISDGYSATEAVAGLGPNSERTVSFSQWTASGRGGFTARCSTALAGDAAPSNDRVSADFSVNVHDAAIVAITSPAGVVEPGPVVPRVVVRNNGTVREAVTVVMTIGGARPYRDSAVVPDGLPNADTAVTLPGLNVVLGRYSVACTLRLGSDQVPDNNVKTAGFSVGSPGWIPMQPVPDMASGRQVKDGGWLAYDAGSGLIYAAKGNKQADFYSYDPTVDNWTLLTAWPPGTENKLPQKGSAGVTDGNGRVYATKGNNTQGFWLYDAATSTWTQKRNVPLGPTNKKVKGGTDIAYHGGAVYLLKGYKNEFWKYLPQTDTWIQLPNTPVGVSPRWDKGSWLASDGRGTLYAHKAKYHEFYAFDVAADTWLKTPLTGMPMQGANGNKKSRDGGCGVWSNGSIFALKGGNTQEFWKYFCDGNNWSQLDTMPRMGSSLRAKKVKAGADIVSTVDGILFALKGNKTNEFWRYIEPADAMGPRPERDGVAAERTAIGDWQLAIGPNPIAGGFATVRCNLPSGVPVRLEVLDVTGRIRHSSFAIRNSSFRVDLRSIPAGVYLVKVQAAGFSTSRKLVVQR
jgi:M6 family metalloprotease-like protein